LLATALKPVGMTTEQLAGLAYDITAGGLHIVKEDQGLANQPWAPYAERVPRVAEAVRRANHDTGGRSVYLPAVNGGVAGFDAQVRLAVREGAHGVLVMPGIAGFGALARAAELFPGGVVLAHPSFLGGFTASAGHGIAPEVLFGTLLRLAGADITIFPSWGGRFSLSRETCLAILDAALLSSPRRTAAFGGRLGRGTRRPGDPTLAQREPPRHHSWSCSPETCGRRHT
jgi:ribulose-bisphosphate carboxylase large chain